MGKKYFSKFPTISYNGFNVKNLMVAAKVVDRYTNLPYVYDRIEIDAEQRADKVAYDYYGDQYLSWAIYYANKTVDPYYGWYLSEDDFQKHLEDEEGSLEEAQTRVIEFRSNWYSDDRKILPTHFVAMFGEYAEPHSKYWTPIYSDSDDRVLYYGRRRSENIVNTNKLVRVGVSNNSPSKFASGDLVDLKTVPGATAIATGEIVDANSTFVTFKNYIGSAIANGYTIALDSNSEIYTTIANYTTSNSFASSVWTITNISDEEYIYWTPYTAYDVEREKNESLKNIKLIDTNTVKKISDSLEEELRE